MQNKRLVNKTFYNSLEKILKNHSNNISINSKRNASYFDELIFKISTRSLNRIHNLINKKQIVNDNIHPNGCCVPGNSVLSVSPKGNYHYCLKISNNETTVIGNILEGIIPDKVEAIKKEYEKISIKKCKKCWALNLCEICYANVHDGFGFNVKLKDQLCNDYRKYLYKNLRFYCELMEKDQTILEYNYDN